MKTPRDILFARHEHAGPKLDAIRREIIAGLNHQNAKAPSWPAIVASWCLGGFGRLWQELILPSRRVWACLSAAWILILLINVSQRDHASKISGQSISSASPTMSLQAQQRWMNELLADRSTPPEAERPRTVSPKPRTQKSETAAV